MTDIKKMIKKELKEKLVNESLEMINRDMDHEERSELLRLLQSSVNVPKHTIRHIEKRGLIRAIVNYIEKNKPKTEMWNDFVLQLNDGNVSEFVEFGLTNFTEGIIHQYCISLLTYLNQGWD